MINLRIIMIWKLLQKEAATRGVLLKVFLEFSQKGILRISCRTPLVAASVQKIISDWGQFVATLLSTKVLY